MPPDGDLLDLLRHVRRHLDAAPSLHTMAARAGWSPFHLHRAFHRVVGETPKQYVLRLRLERAAVRLATTRRPLAALAAAEGFGSHEVFTRAFRRRFGCTPVRYRMVARTRIPRHLQAAHAAAVEGAGPCLGLFHTSSDPPSRRVPMPMLSIALRELQPQPVLFVRSRIPRSAIATTIGESLGKTYSYALGHGLAIAGRPYARYPEMGPGLLTIEVGMPLAEAAPGDGEIQAGVLPGGPAAVAVHAGPYDRIGDTYAAMEQWIEEEACAVRGAPWESYLTDPAEHPDPADWRTEIYWPLAR